MPEVCFASVAEAEAAGFKKVAAGAVKTEIPAAAAAGAAAGAGASVKREEVRATEPVRKAEAVKAAAATTATAATTTATCSGEERRWREYLEVVASALARRCACCRSLVFLHP